MRVNEREIDEVIVKTIIKIREKAGKGDIYV